MKININFLSSAIPKPHYNDSKEIKSQNPKNERRGKETEAISTGRVREESLWACPKTSPGKTVEPCLVNYIYILSLKGKTIILTGNPVYWGSMPFTGLLLYIISQMAVQRGNEVSKLWVREMGFKGLVAQADFKTVYFASFSYLICVFY